MKNLNWYIIGIVILIILEVCGVSWINSYFRTDFWNAIKEYNLKEFYHQLVLFSGVAIALVFSTGYTSYLSNKLSIEMRSRKAIQILNKNFKYVNNYAQKIECSTWLWASDKISLSTSLFRSSLLLISLVYILVTSVTSVTIILIVIAYVVISTIISRLIAKPLIRSVYQLEDAATIFRNELTFTSLANLNILNFKWATLSKYVSLFQGLFSQLSVIFPYLLLFPVFLSKSIDFGTFMMLSSVISQIVDQCGYVVNNQSLINDYITNRNRIKEFDSAPL